MPSAKQIQAEQTQQRRATHFQAIDASQSRTEALEHLLALFVVELEHGQATEVWRQAYPDILKKERAPEVMIEQAKEDLRRYAEENAFNEAIVSRLRHIQKLA